MVRESVGDLMELQALWEFFSVPRSQSDINKKLLARLKYLVTKQLRIENETRKDV